ncbi:hypothetical protein GE061_000366 [Apolygus lucorum]|uniref:Ig-like domain-containing protein n=1 Tax=Apolygus lucorum TaxID=248454 RepID=A0A8S9Y5L8_APOLU|nr:hypothetical protein GE061_000366 [Apolygus lucorum]
MGNLRFRHDQAHLKIHDAILTYFGLDEFNIRGRNQIIYEDKEWGCRGRHGLVFLTRNSTVVTAQTGGNAILPCVIRHLCDGTVSWVRKDNFALLTVGKGNYAYDERLQSLHPFNTNDWTLMIKFVEMSDAGVYECQVTSHPPESIFVSLRVVEARAVIEGPIEKYVKLGSAVDLICVVAESAEVPEFIFWYHNEKMINFELDSTRVLISNLAHRRSTIRIQKAGKEHSGNYSCEAKNAFPASTYVHILKEEKPAAMQTSGSGVPQTFWLLPVLVRQMLLSL